MITLQCSSYWKGNFQVTVFTYIIICIEQYTWNHTTVCKLFEIKIYDLQDSLKKNDTKDVYKDHNSLGIKLPKVSWNAIKINHIAVEEITEIRMKKYVKN